MPSERDIRFASVTPADLPLLGQWLGNPQVREWWGEPDTALDKIRIMVEGRDTTRPFIFSCDGEPAGYIQRWSIGDEVAGGNGAEAPWLLDLPREAVGVDLFIGEPGQLGQGIGTAAMRAFLDRLFAEGVSTVIIDPDETNLRAVRAYKKAGFSAYDRHRHKTGVTLLMKITQDERTETIS